MAQTTDEKRAKAREYAKRYYQANRERKVEEERARRRARGAQPRKLGTDRQAIARRSYYKQRYGLTPEEADAMRAKGCAICGSFARLHIDHCHRTGRVRGVLCNSCNQGLGRFRDDPALLFAASRYLA